jgi:hypothetical protein
MLRCAVIVALALTAACSTGPERPDAGPPGPTVGELIDSGCSTAVVLDLSLQIADEVGCMEPGALVAFEETDGLSFASAAVLPFVSSAARTDLLAAVADNPGELVVNSGFRTVVQQYLLYRWFQLGRCGITAAATPGSSNHESGRAIDVSNYSEWSAILPDYNWEQTVPGDPVHFDHLPSPDNRGLDVLAFQRLWNRNHPDDIIDEDGLFGPDTDARIEISPANGFPRGAECSTSLSASIDWVSLPPLDQPAAAARCAH